MKAKSFTKDQKQRDIRAAKAGSARDAIGVIHENSEIYILTNGQFSMIDAISVILESTGAADVIVSTWTAANAHINHTLALLNDKKIKSLKFLVDRSFITRQPEYCDELRKLFGDSCIRTLRTHCKFIIIKNEYWNVVVRTSMNLNENPRMENLEISNDKRLCDFMLSVVDEIFGEYKEGDFNGQIPSLDGIENVPVAGQITSKSIKQNLKIANSGTVKYGNTKTLFD